MKFYLLLAALFSSPNLISLNLYDLNHETEFLDSGKKLMSLNFGIHDLEPNQETKAIIIAIHGRDSSCLLYTSPSPRDMPRSRMPSSA